MRLRRLELENFRSHVALDLDLSTIECAAVVGRNGAGKSSLLIAVGWCLYGIGNADDLLRRGAERGGVTVTLEGERESLRVARGRERGKKSWLVVERSEDGQTFHPVSRHKIDETQQFLVETLGMDAEAFQASVYAAQGQVGILASLSPGDRKALLGALLGLDEYEDWRSQAALDARAITARLELTDAESARRRARIAELEGHEHFGEDLASIRDAIAEETVGLEAELEAAAEREKAVQQVRLRESLVDQMRTVKDRAAAAKALAEERQRLAAQVQSTASAVVEYDAMDERRSAYEAARARAAAEVSAVRQRVADLSRRAQAAATAQERAVERVQAARKDLDVAHRRTVAAPEYCPTCKQAIEGDARDRAMEAMREAEEAALARFNEATMAFHQATQERESVERELEQATEVAQDAMGPPVAANGYDEAEWRRLRESAREHEALKGRLLGMPQPEDVVALREKWANLKAQAEPLPKEVPPGPAASDVRARLASAQMRAREIELRIERQRVMREEAERLRDEERAAAQATAEDRSRHAALLVCERAFSRNGIPAMILDNAVGAIEGATNDALGRLGSSLRVRLVTQAAKKSGKGTKETLEIMVDDGAFEAPITTFSGGEKYRVHVALRLGLAAALAGGSGREIGFLLVDEPTDLDSPGVSMLSDLLTRAERQVLLVTHQEDLVASMPQRVLVERPSDASPSAVSVA